jgi:hypothetical protein
MRHEPRWVIAMASPPIWPGGAQGSRPSYVAQRVAGRMLARGEQMILRRINKMTADVVPYSNPPYYTSDIVVSTGIIATDGNSYLGLTATTINGRLVAGDQIITGAITWTVQTMPNTISTDPDGIPIAHVGGEPGFATPTIYWPDTLAANNAFPVIQVTAPGAPDPASVIGQPVTFNFVADEIVFGRVLTLEEMTQKSWTQVNTLGVNIAAMYQGVAIAQPAVDDLIYVNGEERTVMAVGAIFRAGVNFQYSLQCH